MHDQKFGQPSTNMRNARYVATLIIKVHNSCTIPAQNKNSIRLHSMYVVRRCIVVAACYGYTMICN